MFVHTHLVNGSSEETTKQYVKGKKVHEEIECPQVVRDYSYSMNGVDKADRDGHDNSVSIWTNRRFLRIWFWTLDRVMHGVYIVVCYIANAGLRDDWKKYTSKENGRIRFQLDLGLGLM